MNDAPGTASGKMQEQPAEIATLSSRLVYENRWMRVREDEILRQDGSRGIYGVVEKTDFVAIVAIEANGDLHLVEQYRYPVGGRFWEIPQGSWENLPEADPLTVARGELREECGLEAGEMIQAGYLYECYGYSNQGCRIFLARQLTAVPRQLDHEEQGLVTRRFSASEVRAMIENGAIRDATTVAAIGLLTLKGLVPGFGATGR
ncbi:NUDIX domain-containing protein [Bosea sp. NPDC055594]